MCADCVRHLLTDHFVEGSGVGDSRAIPSQATKSLWADCMKRVHAEFLFRAAVAQPARAWRKHVVRHAISRSAAGLGNTGIVRRNVDRPATRFLLDDQETGGVARIDKLRRRAPRGKDNFSNQPKAPASDRHFTAISRPSFSSNTSPRQWIRLPIKLAAQTIGAIKSRSGSRTRSWKNCGSPSTSAAAVNATLVGEERQRQQYPRPHRTLSGQQRRARPRQAKRED